MSSVTLEQADVIIATALAKARESRLRPLTVVVLDAGGHAVALKRENDASILRPRIAHGKAWGALGMGLPSRVMFTRSKEQPVFYNALSDLCDGNIVPMPGGVLIRDGAQGKIIGAVGISGDSGDNDEVCAVAGIKAAGLHPDTGADM
ncbi:MAG: heme-binding protein [Hyphomicrobiales bacterium]|nr:heme-binding protein [Hyphomicrobiales bacterium]